MYSATVEGMCNIVAHSGWTCGGLYCAVGTRSYVRKAQCWHAAMHHSLILVYYLAIITDCKCKTEINIMKEVSERKYQGCHPKHRRSKVFCSTTSTSEYIREHRHLDAPTCQTPCSQVHLLQHPLMCPILPPIILPPIILPPTILPPAILPQQVAHRSSH